MRGFVGFDFAGKSNNRKSTFAYVYTENNTCISSKFQLQKIVALSSTEAKYIVAPEVIKEGLWLKGLLNENLQKITWCHVLIIRVSFS